MSMAKMWNPNAAREKKLLLLEIGLKKGQGWHQRCGQLERWEGRTMSEHEIVGSGLNGEDKQEDRQLWLSSTH